MLRGDTGEDDGVLGRVPERLVVEGVEVAPGEHVTLGEPELARDRGGGGRVVAGDHLHRHAGAAAGGDRLRGIAAGRVADGDEPEQREPAERVESQRRRPVIPSARRDGEHAHAIRSVRRRRIARRRQDRIGVHTAWQHSGRCTLDEDDFATVGVRREGSP